MKSIFRIILSVFAMIFVYNPSFYAVDYYARVMLVGDTECGKTSLWRRIFEGGFDENENRSDMMIRRDVIKNIDGKEIQFNIWDTAGAESYYDEVINFSKDANFVIIVHDIDKEFDASRERYLTKLYSDVHKKIRSDGKIMIVGNKWDLRHKDIVNASKHQSLLEGVAKSAPCAFKLVSCKDNSGDINKIVDYLCSTCKKMELSTNNPDSCFQKKFTIKKGWCAIL